MSSGLYENAGVTYKQIISFDADAVYEYVGLSKVYNVIGNSLKAMFNACKVSDPGVYDPLFEKDSVLTIVRQTNF